MRALQFDGKSVRFKGNLPEPAAGAGEVLIRVEAAGLCQTDLEIARGYMGFTGILGHEFIGRVARLGPGVPSDWLDKRVCGEINCICGKCEMCARGLSTHCFHRSVVGILNHDGAFADFLTLPVRNLHLVPEHVSDEQAVFVEPLAAALQILRQLPIEKRTRVTVLGDGRLGQLVAQAILRTGCALTLVGRHEAKLTLAEKICTALAARTARPGKAGRSTSKAGPAAGTTGGGFRTTLERDLRRARDQDVVIDCTGRAEGFQRALSLVRPRGTVVMKTTVADAGAINLAPVVIDEITVLGSRCGPFAEAIGALAAREVDVLPLITKRVTLEQAADLFAAGAMAHQLKVLVRMKE